MAFLLCYRLKFKSEQHTFFYFDVDQETFCTEPTQLSPDEHAVKVIITAVLFLLWETTHEEFFTPSAGEELHILMFSCEQKLHQSVLFSHVTS